MKNKVLCMILGKLLKNGKIFQISKCAQNNNFFQKQKIIIKKTERI